MADIGAHEIATMTDGLDDTSRIVFQTQFSSEKKDRGTATILAILSYDRFWLGQTALGLLKIFTFGGLFWWYLIDIFTAAGRADEYNRSKARLIADALRARPSIPPDLEDGN